MNDLSDDELARAYYLDLAAALVRHRCPDLAGLAPVELFRRGITLGLRLHHFKRTAGLPRWTARETATPAELPRCGRRCLPCGASPATR
jgi:hypothetical protein